MKPNHEVAEEETFEAEAKNAAQRTQVPEDAGLFGRALNMRLAATALSTHAFLEDMHLVYSGKLASNPFDGLATNIFALDKVLNENERADRARVECCRNVFQAILNLRHSLVVFSESAGNMDLLAKVVLDSATLGAEECLLTCLRNDIISEAGAAKYQASRRRAGAKSANRTRASWHAEAVACAEQLRFQSPNLTGKQLNGMVAAALGDRGLNVTDDAVRKALDRNRRSKSGQR